jgi:hypothetical protein
MAVNAAGRTAFHVWKKSSIAALIATLAACGGGGGAAPAGTASTAADPAATTMSSSDPASSLPKKTSAATGLVALAADLANTTLAGNQYVRTVGALDAGGHAVAWASLDSAGAASLFVQRYDASGAKAGGETHVASNAPAQDHAAIAVLRGGTVVTADIDASTGNLVAHRFDASGAAAGGDVSVAAPAAGESLAQPVLLALGDGGVALGWASVQAGASGNIQSLHVQRFDAALNAAGAPVDFAAAGANENLSLKLVATPTGFVTGTTHRFQGISYVRYRIGGTDVGALFDANTAMPEFNTALAPLADGRFALYSIDSSGGYLQLLTPTGHAAGPATRLSVAPLAAVGLPDGGWVTVTNQLYGAPAVAQRFASDASPIGPTVELASAVSQPLASSPVGAGLALAWTSSGTQGADVRTQRLDAR